MVGKSGQVKVLELFFEFPAKSYQIRGIAKYLKLPKTTVASYVNSLIKSGLIVREEKGVFPFFRANEGEEKYKFTKTQYMLKKIIESGVTEYIENETHPRSIVLFGSVAKGEYSKGSDIDLFVESGESKIELAAYEKKLAHPISIHFNPNINTVSPELFNNIVNGIKIKGFLKIK